MIWATVSFQSCFCWLYRTSPSLATKNIINLILVLTIWWCLCVELSLVLLEEGVCYDQCILLAKLLLAFALLHSVLSKAKLTCYSRYLLTSYFCIPVPQDGMDIFSGLSDKHEISRNKQLVLLSDYSKISQLIPNLKSDR